MPTPISVAVVPIVAVVLNRAKVVVSVMGVLMTVAMPVHAGVIAGLAVHAPLSPWSVPVPVIMTRLAKLPLSALKPASAAA